MGVQIVRVKVDAATLAKLQRKGVVPGKVKLPKMSEAEFQKHVIRFAQSRGWRVAHFRRVKVQRKNGSIYHETPVAADGTGWPDLFLVRDAKCLAMELKVKPNKPSAEQDRWLTDLMLAGVEARTYYPDDWQEIIDLLD